MDAKLISTCDGLESAKFLVESKGKIIKNHITATATALGSAVVPPLMKGCKNASECSPARLRSAIGVCEKRVRTSDAIFSNGRIPVCIL
jgi:hypothetical protein